MSGVVYNARAVECSLQASSQLFRCESIFHILLPLALNIVTQAIYIHCLGIYVYPIAHLGGSIIIVLVSGSASDIHDALSEERMKSLSSLLLLALFLVGGANGAPVGDDSDRARVDTRSTSAIDGRVRGISNAVSAAVGAATGVVGAAVGAVTGTLSAASGAVNATSGVAGAVSGAIGAVNGVAGSVSGIVNGIIGAL